MVKVTDSVKSSASLLDVTFGDVWLCSGQSNMALETYYTFSADALKAEVVSEKQWSNVRHFMMGSMGNHYEATTPQFVTVQNSVLADNTTFVWHKLSDSAKLPSKDSTSGQHSAFAQFSSTCMTRLPSRRIKEGTSASAATCARLPLATCSAGASSTSCTIGA